MEVSTLWAITREISGRQVDASLAKNLPQYAGEMSGLLEAVRDVARQFPDELAPAAAFSLKPPAGLPK